MRLPALALIALGTLAGCPEPAVADPTFCTDLRETQADCMDDTAFAACEEANDECPGAVTVMESCPLQFGCEG
jgi:hypothetical protein